MNSKVALVAGCLFLFTIVGDTNADNEFKTVPKLYEEIGCTEVSDNSGSTSFQCPDFDKYDNNKCHLNGKSFKVGDELTKDDAPFCRAACRCLQHEGQAAHIQCADIDCPENHQLFDPNSISQYDDLKQCCRSGKVTDEAKIRAMNTCEVDGKSYRVGERMSPDNTCHHCLCTLDFNNQTAYAQNSNCAKIDCGMGLKLSDFKLGCVPVYYKSPNCCPIEYKCPSKEDAIESHAAATETKTCKFGELTLKRGDSLKSQDKCMQCECSIPPYLTCIKSC